MKIKPCRYLVSLTLCLVIFGCAGCGGGSNGCQTPDWAVFDECPDQMVPPAGKVNK